ncbi:unnamed protein product, partial [Prorocentrum cordatum]
METATFEQGDPGTDFTVTDTGQTKMEAEASEGVSSQSATLKAYLSGGCNPLDDMAQTTNRGCGLGGGEGLGLVGCGGCGVVELCEHRPTGEGYALKGLSKGHVANCGRRQAVMNGKNIRHYTASAALVFEYLHERPVIHRDAKLQNRVLSATGHAKLRDFGVAKLVAG